MFVSLPGGRRVLVEGDTDVEPLAAAIDGELRRSVSSRGGAAQGRALGGRRLEDRDRDAFRTSPGEEIELSSHEGERTLVVDGEQVFGSIPALERPDHVVRARRIVDDVWEVEVHPL